MNNERLGMDDSKVSTKLIDKSYSPLIIRKYTRLGFPFYIAMICDVSLSDLDEVVHSFVSEAEKLGLIQNDIQQIRNFTGWLSDQICKHYNQVKVGCVEGVAVIYYVDKMMVSSLFGDFMNHYSCRLELYTLLNMMCHI